ncbi:hypothetical protein VZT92_018614 [Zoarces viviparus]|uniref:Uncharacterized protein n=1 Tax=Zoarces viviparus TaxID=48416 RepID=A0AAW1EIP1_ZOAVI
MQAASSGSRAAFTLQDSALTRPSGRFLLSDDGCSPNLIKIRTDGDVVKMQRAPGDDMTTNVGSDFG